MKVEISQRELQALVAKALDMEGGKVTFWVRVDDESELTEPSWVSCEVELDKTAG